jgi:chromosomal replication initiator protein
VSGFSEHNDNDADRVGWSDVRELEVAFNRLLAHANLSGRPVTLETTHDLLKAHDSQVTIDDIQR